MAVRNAFQCVVDPCWSVKNVEDEQHLVAEYSWKERRRETYHTSRAFARCSGPSSVCTRSISAGARKIKRRNKKEFRSLSRADALERFRKRIKEAVAGSRLAAVTASECGWGSFWADEELPDWVWDGFSDVCWLNDDLVIKKTRGRASTTMADPRLRLWVEEDRARVLANPLALGHVGCILQIDKELVLAAVRQNGMALAFASPHLKADHQVVNAAVTENGLALEHVAKPRSLQAGFLYRPFFWQSSGRSSVSYWRRGYRQQVTTADRRVVLAAVRQNGMALAHAADALKADGEVVLAAVGQNMGAFALVSEQLPLDVRQRIASSWPLLTVHFGEADAMGLVSILCTSMDGSEVASLGVEAHCRVTELRRSIAEVAPDWEWCQLMTGDGHILADRESLDAHAGRMPATEWDGCLN